MVSYFDTYAEGYHFGISGDGYYYIAKQNSKGTVTVLKQPTYSQYINQGLNAENLIQIECIDNHLSLSVNGHFLTTVSDYAYSGGYISFGASSASDTCTEIIFDNLTVTEP